jgi:hypothetical protein
MDNKYKQLLIDKIELLNSDELEIFIKLIDLLILLNSTSSCDNGVDEVHG